MKTRNVYLGFAIIGFIIPNYFVLMESISTGNWLLWLDPKSTTAGMFHNLISTAFTADLLVAVAVFFIWSYQISKKYNIKNIWIYWALTMLFGVAGPFPLLLYRIELIKEKSGVESN